MAFVNDDGRTHNSFHISGSAGSRTAWGGMTGVVLFWPYDGGKPRKTLQQAITIITKNIVGKVGTTTPCGRHFRTLPNGLSFDAVWRTLWINWHPYNNTGFLGATDQGRREITLTNDCLDRGSWVTAATILHEMAHVNGAPGGTSAAEDTLRVCGMWAHWSRGSVG